jgi:hypothetical protein
MLSANLVAKPILMLPRRVMADQDSSSPTPIAATLHHRLVVPSVMESHSGRWRDTGNSPRGAIFYLRLLTNGEADE